MPDANGRRLRFGSRTVSRSGVRGPSQSRGVSSAEAGSDFEERIDAGLKARTTPQQKLNRPKPLEKDSREGRASGRDGFSQPNAIKKAGCYYCGGGACCGWPGLIPPA